MSRSFWSGTIHFGLINIPVSMQAATKSVDLNFELVDARDFSAIGYRKINKNTGRDVPRDQIVKVLKVDHDEGVVITEADFAKVRPSGMRTLDIVGFVRASEIPAPYYDTPYHLEPEGKDVRAYALLRDSLQRTRRVALGHGVLRTRERYGVILPEGAFLVFNTLRFAHEMRRQPVPDLLARPDHASPAELEMAEQLIQGMEVKWRPGELHDRYRDELVAYSQRKAKAGEARTIFTPESETLEAPRATADNLMDLLKRSLPARSAERSRHNGSRHERKRRSAS